MPGLVRRQRLKQLSGTGHRERQDQPVRLGQGERALDRLACRALVPELTVGEPGQQTRLHGGDVADDRGGAVEHRPHRAQGVRRVAVGQADDRAGIADLA